MARYPINGCGQVGVNRDLAVTELPDNAWTDAKNIRFLDGSAYQFYGWNEVYNSPSYVPQYVLPCMVSGTPYWIYATAGKVFCVTNSGGAAVHTDITPTNPRTGIANNWAGTLLSGIPILNAGDAASYPMSWNLSTGSKFADLANWPASTYCKSIRAFKNYLVALNITKGSTNYPFMVKWSSPANPGSLPPSWDQTDPTQNAGEQDIAEGSDPIIDGMQLRDSFMIYKQSSIWRMDLIGGVYIFSFSKVLGTSGAMNANCIAEVDGYHVVLTNSDVIVHDGVTADSVLDKQTRRWLFNNIDPTNKNLAFVCKNPFFNEVFVCYPSLGSSVCDTAMVWNYKDKTVTFRQIPNLNHAAFGTVDNSLATQWSNDNGSWDSDMSLWGNADFMPSNARVIMASTDQKLYMADGTSSFNGTQPQAYLERRGLTFGDPEQIKLVKRVRPRIWGPAGQTVNLRIGWHNSDPSADPNWGPTMTHTIGSTVSNDCMVSGRYITLRFDTGTAYQWRLDSMDIDIEPGGYW